jgi:ATP-dependent Clp protease ATP-binding subunit ClpX
MNEILKNTQPEHLIQFGIIPELIGRLPVHAPLEELTEDEMVRVLTEPKNAIVQQFVKLFQLNGVVLDFTPDALLVLANLAKTRKTGARGLRSVIEAKLVSTQFKLAELVASGVTEISVTPECITVDKEPTLIYSKNNKNVG